MSAVRSHRCKTYQNGSTVARAGAVDHVAIFHRIRRSSPLNLRIEKDMRHVPLKDIILRGARSYWHSEAMATAASLRPVDTMGSVLNGTEALAETKKPGTFKQKFLDAYQKLKEELVAESGSFQFTDESRNWVTKMLDYNVPGGKLNRGLSVIDSLVLLKSGKELSEDEVFHAFALGWCIEWLQAYFLVLDDIMDDSHTRRGQLCWYRQPKVGLIAANDGILLRNHIPRILRRHFRSKPYYLDLLELFNEVEYQTACGQMLDLITTPAGEVDLSKYVMETYLRIVKFKTAYYSFYLPVACALHMCGEGNKSKFESSERILVQMGTYFQIQDDYLDCYGHPDVIGKVGTDIEDTKCSWLIVQAIARANPEQRQRLRDNYGRKNPACVAEVKRVYGELKLEKVFLDYEQESYKELIAAIEREESLELQQVLKSFLSKIYKRQK